MFVFGTFGKKCCAGGGCGGGEVREAVVVFFSSDCLGTWMDIGLIDQ